MIANLNRNILTYNDLYFICLIIDFFVIRDMKAPLSQIRVSLVTSLGAGQTIFLAGIGATESKVKLLIQLPIQATSRFT